MSDRNTGARELFRSVLHAERELRDVLAMREHYLALATGGAGVTSVRRMRGNHHSRVESSALALADLLDDLDERERTYAQLSRKADLLIARLDKPHHRQVLRLRYLCGMNWEEIATRMDYSNVRSAYRTHGWALLEAERIMGARDAI